ncbi:MAG: hypothetical protein AB7W37_08375 [Syntrophobacteraceae bacterium]
MGGHANKKIENHIDQSKELSDKMQKLGETLLASLQRDFEANMGCPLPNIIRAKVRATDIVMAYSTDPSVDEYINGARKLLGAALGGEKLEIINGMLDVVDVVVTKIIGSGAIQVGMHGSSAWTGDYVTAVFSAIQRANAKDWFTQADFYVAYYAFVVFNPAPVQAARLSASPMFMGMMEKPQVVPTTREIAARNYTYTPL